MKYLKLLLLCCCTYLVSAAQEPFPVNDGTDICSDYFAFTNATIVKDTQTILENATPANIIVSDDDILDMKSQQCNLYKAAKLTLITSKNNCMRNIRSSMD